MDLSIKLQKTIICREDQESPGFYTASATATDEYGNTTTTVEDLTVSTEQLELGWNLPILKHNLESTLHLPLTLDLQMNIFIITSTGKTITLNVRPSDPVSQIKFEIYVKTRVDTAKQVLFLDERVLEDDNETLEYYGIKKGSMLVLRTRDAMHVMVRIGQREALGFEVFSSNTVYDVKLIFVKKGIRLEDQKLILDGRLLGSREKLEVLGAKEGTLIHLLHLRFGSLE